MPLAENLLKEQLTHVGALHKNKSYQKNFY
jgi:hypothetical protein